MLPRANEYEQGAQGTARISVIGPRTPSNRQSSWGDGKTQTVEERLPAVLMEVEARAAEERERILLEQQAAERRQLAWEEAMERARRRHTEHHRIEALDAQIAAWRRATTIRDFCDAVEQQRPGDAAAAKWCAWARAYADGIDPLGTSLAIPDPPANVSPLDLEPFLDGWSPYGPERWAGRWR